MVIMMTQVMMLNPLRKRMVSAPRLPIQEDSSTHPKWRSCCCVAVLAEGAVWCVQALRPMMQILAYGSVIDNDGPRL